MENFARLFVLRLNLEEYSQGMGSNKHTSQGKWRSVDRLIALYGPPDVINHAWIPSPPKENRSDETL